MQLSARRLNRATLARQLLLARADLTVPEAVHRVVALQAQSPPSPYLALWARVAGFAPDDLDRAFRTRSVVKASLMRITLHAVHRDDWAPFHAAMQPVLRAARLHDRRYRDAGLTTADAEELLGRLAGWTREPRDNAASQAWATEQLGRDGTWAWWALRTFGPLHHAPTGGPWQFGTRPAYVDAEAPSGHPDDPDRALQHLVLRYLAGFGPATVADLTQFSLVSRARVRAAVAGVRDRLVEHTGPDGSALLDLPSAPLPDEETPAPPRLLGMWDSTLLAYADRRRMLPESHRAHVIRRNGDVLPSLLVDGRVAGVWRAVEGGIEATAFEPLEEGTWDALAEEATALRGMLAGRETQVYRRHHGWWSGLPDRAETRLLTG